MTDAPAGGPPPGDGPKRGAPDAIPERPGTSPAPEAPIPTTLTDRQARELAYHRERAARIAVPPPDLGVVTSDDRRWWNPYWTFYTRLRKLDLAGKRALVLGCGYGNDVIFLHEMGARAAGCDLSPESVDIARQRAEGRAVEFTVAPCERLPWPDDTFDVVVAVDILHHCEIGQVLDEVRRVSRDGALFAWDEVYTHRALTRVRESAFVRRVVYPLVGRKMYGKDEPYITEDERKLGDDDIDRLRAGLHDVEQDWFHFLAGRAFPVDWKFGNQADRLLMRALRPFGRWLASRSLGVGTLRKPPAA